MHMGALRTDVVPPALRARGATCPDRHVMGFDAMQRHAMQCGQILRWHLSGRWCVYSVIDSNLLVLNFLVVQCLRKYHFDRTAAHFQLCFEALSSSRFETI